MVDTNKGSLALVEVAGAEGRVGTFLERFLPQLEQAATDALEPRRLLRVFMGLANSSPKLFQCELSTVIASLSICNQLGLEPGAPMGYCWLIARKNLGRDKQYHMECCFQAGYKGYIELGRRGGQIASLAASPVYQYEIDRGLFELQHFPQRIVHRHSFDARPADRVDAKIVGWYAAATLLNGSLVQAWMDREAVEKRRRVSQAPDSPMWVDWYPEAGRKTVLASLFRSGSIPLSIQIVDAMRADVDSIGARQALGVESSTVRRGRTAGLQDALEAHAAAHALPEAQPPIDVQTETEAAAPAREPEPAKAPSPAPRARRTKAPAQPQERQPTFLDLCPPGTTMMEVDTAAGSMGVAGAPESWSKEDRDRVLHEIEAIKRT